MTEKEFKNLEEGDYVYYTNVGQHIIREAVEWKSEGSKTIHTQREDLPGIPYQVAYLTPEEAKKGEKLYQPLKEN